MAGDATFVPVVFPLFVGAGALTTLLSIRSQYADVNILSAVVLVCVCIYGTVKLSRFLKKHLSNAVIYVLKKFFGMVLLAMSVKLFITNVAVLVHSIR